MGRWVFALLAAVALLLLPRQPGSVLRAQGGAEALPAPKPSTRPELELQIGHTGVVWGLVFLPEGKTLASAGGNQVKLWDVATGTLLRTLLGHRDTIHGLALSPDGRTLASASEDATVRLWDVRTGASRHTLAGHARGVGSVAFSPDGRRLVSGGWDRTVKLWDVETGKEIQTLLGVQSLVHSVAFSPDGTSIACGTLGSELMLWDARTGEMRWTVKLLPSRGRGIVSIAFSPDGKTLAGGGATEVGLWDVRTGRQRGVLKGHDPLIMAIAYSADGRRLASASLDNTARVWEPETGALLGTFNYGDQVSAVAFSPDGKLLASGSTVSTIKLWDVETGTVRRILGRPAPVLAVAASPDGTTIASAGLDSAVRLWDLRTGTLQRMLTRHTGQVAALAFSPDRQILASASSDGSVKLWNVRRGTERHTLPWATPSLAFSPDGKTLAGGGGNDVTLWDVPTGKPRRTLAGHTSAVFCVAFSPDGRSLASGSVDGMVQVWDTDTGEPRRALARHGNVVSTLAFSPDGETLATGIYDGTVKLWDVRTGEMRRNLLPGDSYRSVAFSPDGKSLAAVGNHGLVKLWDLKTGELQRSLIGHRHSANTVAFSPDSRRIISGSSDSTVRVWDANSGRLLATLVTLLSPGQETVSTDWLTVTPEGYLDGSAGAARFIRWNVNGALYPVERYLKRFRRPDLVRRSLRGEPITARALTVEDIPPAAVFVGLRDGASAPPSSTLPVTVEVRDDRGVKEVELLVNGRPLPPDRARPLPAGGKPIALRGKDGDPYHWIARRFTFRVPVPQGAPEIHLRASAADDAGLWSDPVEVVLRNARATPRAGNLYVLAVGVSRYRYADGRQLKNLRYPAADARAIADRFRREGRPLYARVEVRPLVDQDATAANVRTELRRLQGLTDPRGIDTVVVFLSGHGISLDGRYFFATHETDLRRIPQTTLAGKELATLLGGQLRARSVFLFVDTCHSGGLGGRNDDLALEVADRGVYVLCSSGATEYAYESAEWGHGAFTHALLRALDRRSADGIVRFNALASGVPDEVTSLMREAGRSESEQQPRFLAVGPLRAPIAGRRGDA